MDQAELKSHLEYDADAGAFRRIRSGRGYKLAGPVGRLDKSGHRYIGIGKKNYAAHRLAWLWIHGSWPRDEIDHINGNRDDNRIVNLREATRSLNAQNVRRARLDSVSKLLGAYKQRHGGFVSSILVEGHRRHLGSFRTAEAAHAAYIAAKRELHPGCTI